MVYFSCKCPAHSRFHEVSSTKQSQRETAFEVYYFIFNPTHFI